MKAYQVIEERRDERGIPCAELARRVDMQPELLRRGLTGLRNITAEEFVALCKELHLDLSDFKEVA